MALKNIMLLSVLMFAVSGKASTLTCSPAPCVTSNVPIGPNMSTTPSIESWLVSDGAHLVVDTNFFNTANTNSYCYSTDLAQTNSQWGAWRSSDTGGTWTAMGTSGCLRPATGAKQTWAGDPHAVFDSSNNLFVSTIVNRANTASDIGVWVRKSTDWGNTLGTAFQTAETTTENCPGGSQCNWDSTDYDGLAVDTTTGTYAGCLYSTFTEYSINDGVESIAFNSACPSNYTMSNSTNLSGQCVLNTAGQCSLSHVMVDQNGKIYVFWLECGVTDTDTDDCAAYPSTAQIYERSSTSGGSTWSAASNIFSVQQYPTAACANNDHSLPNYCNRILPSPVTVSTKSGSTVTLHQVFANWNTTAGEGEIVYHNSTNGTTWSNRHSFTHSSDDEIQPCIATDGTNIGVAWTDTRNSPSTDLDRNYDVYASTSTDGGTTWSSHYRISTKKSDSSLTFQPDGVGDYNGCTWQGGIFYTTWSDNSNGTWTSTNKGGQMMIGGLNP